MAYRRNYEMKYKRKEYPRPQFRRDIWQSLNGEWEFGFGDKQNYDRKINVPFSYQIGIASCRERVFILV